MSRLLRPCSSPLARWTRTATWYQLAQRFLAVYGGDAKANLAPTMASLAESLEAEAVVLVEVYGAGKTALAKRTAKLVENAWAEVKAWSEEPVPGSGLGAGSLDVVKKAADWIKAIGPWLIGLWVVAEIGPNRIFGGVSRLFESDEEKEQRKRDSAFMWREQRQAELQKCLDDCGADRACLAECKAYVEDVFDTYGPSADECGLLDTPAGTSLGGMFGLLGGWVTGQTVIGWAE